MNRLQLKIIEQAIDQPHKLSTWESDFIESLDDRGEDYNLSDKQNEILNRIGSKLE